MAKKLFKPRKHESGRTITTQTPYGVTNDMVVKDEEILAKVVVSDGMVLVQDDDGYFIVPKNVVDNRMACPLRYDEDYRNQMAETINHAVNGG